jgi:lysophospholipase L1-like esterase
MSDDVAAVSLPTMRLGATVLLLLLASACGSTEPNEASAPPAEGSAATPPGSETAPGNVEGPTGEGTPASPAEAAAGPEPGAPDPVTEVPAATPGNGALPGTGGAGETPNPAEASGGSAPVPPVAAGPITIWVAGDSTVANGQTPCPRGWGGVFASHFDDRVTVNNSAAGGRSVHTWLYEVEDAFDATTGECALTRDESGAPLLQPRWQTMLDGMQAGDYLLIQFGINDGDPSCDRHVGIEAFKTAYGMMAEAAKARGAHPVFLTPVSMIRCNGSTAVGSRGEFVPATIEAGAEFDVPVIDLHARSIALFQSLGFCPIAGGDVSAATGGPVGDFFCDDHTHFSSSGAAVIAELVAQAMAEQALPLAGYLSE